MENGNSRTVFVVCIDHNKDVTDAKRFGKLRGVFSNVHKPYNTNGLIRHARYILKDWQPGDHLLFMGDPALCAVAVTVVSEYDDCVNVLQWDRMGFRYEPCTWNFSAVNSTHVES